MMATGKVMAGSLTEKQADHSGLFTGLAEHRLDDFCRAAERLLFRGGKFYFQGFENTPFADYGGQGKADIAHSMIALHEGAYRQNFMGVQCDCGTMAAEAKATPWLV